MIQQKVTGLVFQREEKADELSAAPLPITLEQQGGPFLCLSAVGCGQALCSNGRFDVWAQTSPAELARMKLG